MMRMQVGTYAVGGWAEPAAAPFEQPLISSPFVSVPIPPPARTVIDDVASVKAEGVSAATALRVLAAVGWDVERAMAVVLVARLDGEDPVALAREIGAAK